MISLNNYIENSTINEAKKQYDINGSKVVKGQQMVIKHWRDNNDTMVVLYAGEHENPNYFYCYDLSGKLLAFKKEMIIEIIPMGKNNKKVSLEKITKWESELSDIENQIRQLMLDQEEYATTAMNNAKRNGTSDNEIIDAPNYDKDFINCWKQIDKLGKKQQELSKKINDAKKI